MRSRIREILIAGRKTSGNETERQEKNTLMRRAKVCEWRRRPQEHRYIVQMYRTCGRRRQIYESLAVTGTEC